MDTLELRAAEASDMEFLYLLHRQALGPYVEATWGWDEAWQAAYFRAHVDPAARRIIRHSGSDVGCISVEDRGSSLFLAYVALLPTHQGQGIGTHLVRQVTAKGDRRGIPVTLTVLLVNPARALYERLGFRVTSQDQTRCRMVRSPDLRDDLTEAYPEMAADEAREAEALEWAEATLADFGNESTQT